MLFASAAGVPTGVPIFVVLMLAGASLIGSLPGLAATVVLLAAAELGGTLSLHLLARTGGVRLLQRVAQSRQERVEATFANWRGRLGGRDVPAIAILRLIPVVRMGTVVGAGLVGIRLRDFVLGSAIAALIWTALPLSLGFAFRSNIASLEGAYAGALDVLLMTLGLLGLLIVAVVLGRSAATRASLSRAFSSLRDRFRAPASLTEIPQEPPPVV